MISFSDKALMFEQAARLFAEADRGVLDRAIPEIDRLVSAGKRSTAALLVRLLPAQVSRRTRAACFSRAHYSQPSDKPLVKLIQFICYGCGDRAYAHELEPRPECNSCRIGTYTKVVMDPATPAEIEQGRLEDIRQFEESMEP